VARIHVKNWGSFQHYKDRRPQWIKLHHELLDDYEFHCLPVASRALAPCIWLLASESEDGSIDYDLKKISFRLHLSEVELQQALKPLIESSFIYVEQDASDVLAETEQNASLEKRREETEREKSAALAERKVVNCSGNPADLNSTECAIVQCRELGHH
jgi:AraC-like DNA-binding protein